MQNIKKRTGPAICVLCDMYIAHRLAKPVSTPHVNSDGRFYGGGCKKKISWQISLRLETVAEAEALATFLLVPLFYTTLLI
jgi:hypothetical protein